MLGAILMFIGLAACAVAAVRGRGGVRMLVWFGIFSALYGARLVAEQPAGFGLLPRSMAAGRLAAVAAMTYLILIPALLFWWELALGGLRRVLEGALGAAMVGGAAGLAAVLFSPSPLRLMGANNALAIGILILLAPVNAIPRLARKYLAIPSRVAAAGTLILAAAALYANLEDWLRLPSYPFLEPLAFSAFVLSLGYVAAEKVFGDERRLLSIEKELAIAREIQGSILPRGDPELNHLRVSAAYAPMTAVAGDFYEFVLVDENRAGFLVADVAGHGVPAALIASMIKVAMHSVTAQAEEPHAVLGGLNRILSGQLRGQLVSAAYLWLDTAQGQASYAAAGHPPLLRWRDGALERIESNGLLFGVLPNVDYPVCEMPLRTGDRFLLYTDGVTEPENASGDAFGDRQLEQVVRNYQSGPPVELTRRLLGEIREWQPAGGKQQDDITLIVIDVV